MHEHNEVNYSVPIQQGLILAALVKLSEIENVESHRVVIEKAYWLIKYLISELKILEEDNAILEEALEYESEDYNDVN